MAMAIPVYSFTGFLDAGKTKFIQETLCDTRFNAGERTLLLLCEEGEEEFGTRYIKRKHSSVAFSVRPPYNIIERYVRY